LPDIPWESDLLNPDWLTANLDDEDQMARLSDWVGEWDPSFWIARPPRQAILFEPDATLYGIAAGSSMTISLHHRRRTIATGDAVVVPQGLALEIEPQVDLLAIRCSGTWPDHFRERFIQVWGYDHFPAPGPEGQAQPARFLDVISADLRYRLRYAIAQPAIEAEGIAVEADSLDLTLVLSLDGQVTAALDGGTRMVALSHGIVLGLAPGSSMSLAGAGRAGLIRLVSEPVYHARRVLEQSRGWQPGALDESQPSQPGGSRLAPGKPGLTDDLHA
jgi:hypothetical protein